MSKTTVICHSADYDGIFSREVAKKFLGVDDVEYIGWDFGHPKIPVPLSGLIYIIDLSPECLDAPYGELLPSILERIIWIDHHKSSIEKWPTSIPGYRIDGVAACRLAWHWFSRLQYADSNPGIAPWVLAEKQVFIDRKVNEPLAVRLAGEYDIWDHRGDGDVEFQFGMDCQEFPDWNELLSNRDDYAKLVVQNGVAAMACYAKRDADVMRSRSFTCEFEGLKFLCLCTARCNSNTFAARDVPETGHDALMAFYYTGKGFSCSLYHAAHRKDVDLSKIAVKYGGGGHRGACGFRFGNFRHENGKFQII